MSTPDEVEINRKIDQLAGEFESVWSESTPADFRKFLDQVDSAIRPRLAEELIKVDFELRRNAGAPIAVSEYGALGSNAFQYAVELSINDLEQTQSFAHEGNSTHASNTSEQGLPSETPKTIGNYVLEGELGRGGMGVVYKARHQKHGNLVALKILPSVDGERLHKFKREFRSLSGISHPNLISLFSLEYAKEGWYFTMEILTGAVDFLSYVRPNNCLDEDRLRSCLQQLSEGVEELHANQIIHCDLKPGNVLVDSDGILKLLDFGLVSELSRRDMTISHSNLSGTPIYMAPEQAQSKVVPASDWYAVGVMIYEALSGTRPFTGNVMQILMAKQRGAAPPFPSDIPMPEDLASLSLRLIEREPPDRPPAKEIVSSLKQSTCNIELNGGAASGGNLGDSVQSETALVGRESQLSKLNNAFNSFEATSNPTVVFVSGKSGEGKTVLTEQFLYTKRSDPKFVVISGRCYDRESVPFKALDSLVDGIASYLRTLSKEDAAYLFPRDIGLLSNLFPVLNRVDAIQSAPTPRISGLDSHQIRTRAFASLRELMVRMTDRGPVIVFIDDLQWGDGDSADVLFDVLKPPEGAMLFFVGTYRVDEADQSEFLTKWSQLRNQSEGGVTHVDISVGSFDQAACVEFVLNLLGDDTPELRMRAKELAAQTGGNPFLLSELAETLSLDSADDGVVALHQHIEAKLSRIGSSGTELLRIVAVFGQALRLDDLWAASKETRDESALIALQNQRLIRTIGHEPDQLVDTYHDRIRETVLGSLDESIKIQFHLAIAHSIERMVGGLPDGFFEALDAGEILSAEELFSSGRLYDLAYHFDKAKDSRSSLAYSLLAAAQGNRQFSPQIVAQQFEIAKRNCEGTHPSIRFAILSGLGKALIFLGEYQAADAVFIKANEFAGNAVETGLVLMNQGDIASKQGELVLANNFWECAIRHFGHWVPNSRVGLSVAIAKEVTIRIGKLFRTTSVKLKEAPEETKVLSSVLIQLQHTYGFMSVAWWIWSVLKASKISEKYRPSSELAMAYAQLAVIQMMVGMLGSKARSKRHLRNAFAIADESSNLWVKGNVNAQATIGHWATAQFTEGLTTAESAIDSFNKAGEKWYVNMTNFHKACCHYGLGDIGNAVESGMQALAKSFPIADNRVMCSSWILTRVLDGNIDFDLLKPCYPISPDDCDVLSISHGRFAESLYLMHMNETSPAIELLLQTKKALKQNVNVQAHTVLVWSLLSRAYRQLANEKKGNSKEFYSAAKKALSNSTWATRLTRFMPAPYPEALREHALNLQLMGRLKKALKYANKSAEVAKKQDASLEFSRSNLLAMQLGRELGLASNADVDQAIDSMNSFEQKIESAKSVCKEFLESLHKPSNS